MGAALALASWCAHSQGADPAPAPDAKSTVVIKVLKGKHVFSVIGDDGRERRDLFKPDAPVTKGKRSPWQGVLNCVALETPCCGWTCLGLAWRENPEEGLLTEAILFNGKDGPNAHFAKISCEEMAKGTKAQPPDENHLMVAVTVKEDRSVDPPAHALVSVEWLPSK